MKPPVIDVPGLQSLKQKYIYSTLTFIFWLLWFYLWLPMISLMAWVFGIDLFRTHMFLNEGLAALIDLLGLYGVTIALIALGLGVWAIYNYTRFRNKQRRQTINELGTVEQAEFYDVDLSRLQSWQQLPRMYILHDVDGNINQVSSNQIEKSDLTRASGTERDSISDSGRENEVKSMKIAK
ncbi:MAG: poly-beta-1,6-N-acetyl-D-glucosamine biosynthesis protein PgaD [Gammaproteobacteria bacterium]